MSAGVQTTFRLNDRVIMKRKQDQRGRDAQDQKEAQIQDLVGQVSR